MIIDAHTHIYPEKIAAKAIEKLEKNSGVKAKTNGIESGLRESMKEAGIDYSLLLLGIEYYLAVILLELQTKMFFA